VSALATSSGVPLYAGFWRRATAASLDVVLLLIPMVMVARFMPDGALQQFVNIILGCGYYAGFHSSSLQATPGKKVFGIKVTDHDGGRIGIGRAVGRYFAAWLSFAVLGVGFLLAAFTRKRQALHDLICSTLVVNGSAQPSGVVAGGGVIPVTAGVWVVAIMFIVLAAVGGILAGISIPGYQGYTLRAKVADVIGALYADHARSRFDLTPLDAAALADPDTQVKLAFVYAALANSREVHVHQMRGAVANKIFVSPDGHSEAVYDEHGKLVTDCVNMASYNYFRPDREPLEHFIVDTLPWIESGNCMTDPTSRTERINAYLRDFRNGAIDAFNDRPAPLPNNLRFNGKGQAEAAAFFLKALIDTPAQEMLMLYTDSATSADFERFFSKFSRAFSRICRDGG